MRLLALMNHLLDVLSKDLVLSAMSRGIIDGGLVEPSHPDSMYSMRHVACAEVPQRH